MDRIVPPSAAACLSRPPFYSVNFSRGRAGFSLSWFVQSPIERAPSEKIPSPKSPKTQKPSGPLPFLILILVLMAFSCSKEPALEAFERAENLFADGRFMEAVNAYSEVVKLYPDSPYAPKSQFKLGLVYSRHIKDFKRALDAYSKLFLLYPRSKETILARRDRARIFSDLGDPRRAIEEYQILLDQDPSGKKDLYQYRIAMEYVKLNDIVQARIELNDLVSEYPSSDLLPEAHYQVANTFYLEGRLEEAVKSFDKVIESYGDLPIALEARLAKAASLEEMGSLAEALHILEGLKESYPNRKVVETRIEWIKKRLKEGPRKVGSKRKKGKR